MFTKIFIDRPVLATVISIVITLMGILALFSLPVTQYPRITPPTVNVTAVYPGANAQTVEQTVATIVEKEVNGVDDMLYLSSTSSNDGTYQLTVTFKVGVDVDQAAINVQNRVSIAQPQLPSEVISQGLKVEKATSDMLMIVGLVSPDNSFDNLFLSNYATINVVDALLRVPGVGKVTIFGQQDYGMRVWFNPDAMTRLGITTSDVTLAIREQNAEAAIGKIGEAPASDGQSFQYPLVTKGRLTEVSEFEQIIIRALPDGSIVRLKDIARIELGARSYTNFSRLNGTPGTMIAVFQTSGANALDVASGIKAKMKELSERFPPGLAYQTPFDTTTFVSLSIEEVITTLIEAFVLVFLVVFLFLQSWRAVVIPLVAVPVSLIGTLGLLLVFGFSINLLTLFALVLAVGIVVDDAIVVVEAVQHKLDHDPTLSPRDATLAAMIEVTGPIIGISLVLSAVFIPVSFLGGITGEMFKQFALTMASAVAISTVNALTFTPAMCALLLRPTTKSSSKGLLNRFFGGFDRFFEKTTAGYKAGVVFLLRKSLVGLTLLAVLSVGAVLLFKYTSTTFVPDEDQGYVFVSIQLPDAASLERTTAVINQVEEIVKTAPGVKDFISIGGQSMLLGVGSNMGMVILNLKHWDERKTADLQIKGVMAGLSGKLAAIPEAIIFAAVPPPIPGLGSVGGFDYVLEDRSGGQLSELTQAAQAMVGAANQRPELAGVYTTLRAGSPQISLDIDREKAKSLGVSLSDIYSTLSANLASLPVVDFNRFGRTYKVVLEAEPEFRAKPENIGQFYVRNAKSEMVPLATLINVRQQSGPESIARYNLFRSASIRGNAASGYASGDAVTAMEAVSGQALPAAMGYEWTGVTYQEKESGGQLMMILGLTLVFVFLLLAALYESWAIPFSVILGVPLGVFGAVFAMWMRGLIVNVYFQIGLVMLIGLAVKNAILIVEFAKMRHEEGMSLRDAAVDGAVQRFRPILMTSFAFILGVVPLVISTGAGAGSRQALGTAVFGGMTAATLFGVFLIPWLYVVVQGLTERKPRAKQPDEEEQLMPETTP